MAQLLVLGSLERRFWFLGPSNCSGTQAQEKCDSANHWPCTSLNIEPVSNTKLAFGCAVVPGDHILP